MVSTTVINKLVAYFIHKNPLSCYTACTTSETPLIGCLVKIVFRTTIVIMVNKATNTRFFNPKPAILFILSPPFNASIFIDLNGQERGRPFLFSNTKSYIL